MKTATLKRKFRVIVLLVTFVMILTVGKVQAKEPPSLLEFEYKHTIAETKVYLKIPMIPMVIPLSGGGAYGAYYVWKHRKCKRTYKKRNRPR